MQLGQISSRGSGIVYRFAYAFNLKGNNAYHLVLAQIKHEIKHFGKGLFRVGN